MADIIIDSDSGKFKAGDDADLEIYNNGSHSYIANATASQSIVLRTRASGGSTADAVTIDADKNVTIEGNLTVNKAITFNEESADADFRVESNNNANMLFVDGGNDRVGIGTGSPDSHLHIKESSNGTNAVFHLEAAGGSGTENAIIRLTNPSDAWDIYCEDNTGSGDLRFYNGADRVTIEPGGNVGIGTDGPQDTLDIYGGADGNSGMRITSTGSGTGSVTYLDLVHADGNYRIQNQADKFGIYDLGASAMRMVIDNAGSVGIGLTGPGNLLHVQGADGGAVDNTAVARFQSLESTNNRSKGIHISAGSTVDDWAIHVDDHDSSNTLMRLCGNGYLALGHASPVHPLHVISDGTISTLKLVNDHESAPQGMMISFTDAAPDNNTQEAFKFSDTGNNRCIIWSDGDVNNADNAYGSLSDARAKQGIRDANSQWDDIKAIKVRNFKKTEDVLQYGDKAWEQIGVIAQELEESGMDKLVREHPADEFEIANNEDINEGDMVKSVVYSIIYMKAIKALQEAMAKIEILESKVTALENA